MDADQESRLRRGQLAFQGRIIASATHEFQNHFAVIKEYNGLAGDLLAVRKPDRKSIERCSEIAGAVGRRAILAGDMVECLNRFAHRSDHETARFVPADVVDDMAQLMGRLADQRRIDLQAVREGEAISVLNNASLLQYLLFMLVTDRLESLAEHGSVVLGTRAAGEGDAVIIELTATGSQRQADMAEETGQAEPEGTAGLLELCASRMSCRLQGDAAAASGAGTGPGRVELILPSLDGAGA